MRTRSGGRHSDRRLDGSGDLSGKTPGEPGLKNHCLETCLQDQGMKMEEIFREYSVMPGVSASTWATPRFSSMERCGGKHILFEGAQGTHLDVASPRIRLSLPPTRDRRWCLHGRGASTHQDFRSHRRFQSLHDPGRAGPFPTELNMKIGERIRQQGGELGATTGRPRRTGWLDIPVLRDASVCSGITHSADKMDVLSRSLRRSASVLHIPVSGRILGKCLPS